MKDARLSNPPPPIGRTHIGRFAVIYPLAHGGMASVHVGRISGMAGFEKLVAIKVIHPHLACEESFVTMFLDEARLAAQIHHPNAGEVIEVGEDGGLYYMVSELIVGQSLRNLYRRAEALCRKIPRPMSADICAKVCGALHEAHELKDGDGKPLGIVHRDISPRNVLVSYNGFVKLIDFGIAWAKGRMSHTDVGQVKGRIGYIPPEQLKGQPFDRRGDLFSLGVMLYLMVIGKHPFPGVSDAERMHKIVNGVFVPPRLVIPGIEPDLEAVIKKAMAGSPDDRYATAAEMGRDLKSYVHASSTLPGGWDSSNELQAVMHDLFEDEQLRHRERIREAAEVVGSDKVFEAPARAPKGATPVSLGETAMTATGTHRSIIAKESGGWAHSLRLVIAGGAVAIAAVVALSLALSDGGALPPSRAPEPDTRAALIASPAEPLYPAPVRNAAEDAAPLVIHVAFDVQPPEAVISVDGARLAEGARELDLAPDGKTHSVTIEAPGYATERGSFVADVDHTFLRRLDKLSGKKDRGKQKGVSKKGRGGKKLRDLGFMDSPF
ncbi:MAG: serine/threonine protein kinase [Proteobacteria bacterium]|jgi:serine/threonine-protein kinase|nr:serine/threonine protein kinase [Pseudomonadota bacterium]